MYEATSNFKWISQKTYEGEGWSLAFYAAGAASPRMVTPIKMGMTNTISWKATRIYSEGCNLLIAQTKQGAIRLYLEKGGIRDEQVLLRMEDAVATRYAQYVPKEHDLIS